MGGLSTIGLWTKAEGGERELEMVTATPLSATPWSPGLLILFLHVAAGGSK